MTATLFRASALAEALSARTGSTWTVRPGEARRGFGTDIDGPDGAVLNIQAASYSVQRIEGMYPDTRRGNGLFSVTVAAERDAAAVAGHVARRLLPGYLAELAEIEEFEAAKRAEFEARTETVGAIEDMFGPRSDFGTYEPHPDGTRREADVVSVPLRLRGASGKHGKYPDYEFARVTATYGAEVLSLELKDIPAPVVVRMLRVLADYTATLPEPGQGEVREPRPFSPEFERLYDEWVFSGACQRISWEDWFSRRGA